MKTTIILADDHPLFRSGVRTELERNSQFNIVGETGDGETAYNLIISEKPDIAILDFQMPKLNALEVLNRLSREKIATRIIMLTMHRDRKIFYKALEAGVMGYVLKDDVVLDIVKAVEYALSNRHFVSENLTELLVEKAIDNNDYGKIKSMIDTLTATEKKVLLLIAELKSNSEIAEKLFISKRTIENYRSTISSKLNLNRSKELLKFALQNKEYLADDDNI